MRAYTINRLGNSNLLWPLINSRYVRFLLRYLDSLGFKLLRMLLFRKELRDIRNLPVREELNLTVRVCSSKDLRQLRVRDKKEIEAFMKDLKNGHKMIAAFIEGKIVGYIWVSFRKAYIPEIEQHVIFDGVYLWRLYTDINFRRKGIAKRVVNEVLRITKKSYEGKKAYAVVDIYNIPSKKVCYNCGFIPFKKITIFKIFGKLILRKIEKLN